MIPHPDCTDIDLMRTEGEAINRLVDGAGVCRQPVHTISSPLSHKKYQSFYYVCIKIVLNKVKFFVFFKIHDYRSFALII